ncbi:hypothetical protein ARSEF1564_009127 [Beauveria bassiana]
MVTAPARYVISGMGFWGRLRTIFEYLNPLVKIIDANISRTTIRHKVLASYEAHKDKVAAVLQKSPGLIHISFDGWRSGNRHSLYGVTCFFRDGNSKPCKLVLGVPELRTRHFGHDIAAEILDTLAAHGIQDKIRYFTLDNAESNDAAMEVIGGELRFVRSTRRGRYFGHSLNLSAKALLFGHNAAAFEEQLSGAAPLSEAEHTLWRRKGPVGKLHNLVVDVRRSDQLTYLLRSIQRSEFDMSSDPKIQASTPLDLIIDNDTLLEHLAKLLGFYENAVRTLEGDGQPRKRKQGWVGSYGNVWEVIQGFEFLLEALEGYKQLAYGIPDPEHFRINVNLGWEKLNKYYRLLDDTPIYCTALALHPAFRWGYFETEWQDRPDWVKKAKQMVREVWETQYRRLRGEPSVMTGDSAAKRQRKYYNPFQAYYERTRSVSGSAAVKDELADADRFDGEDDEDELELWQSSWEDGDGDIRDPLSYWHERYVSGV